MFEKRKDHPHWGRRIVWVALFFVVIALGVDYGKHALLKSILEKEMDQSEGRISFGSISVSYWPLLESKLVISNCQIYVSGKPVIAKTINIRQGLKEWGIAHVDVAEVASDNVIFVQEAHGILDTKDLKSRVKMSDLILKNITVNLPLISFSGQQLSSDFLYELSTHQLDLKVDAPQMMFSNGAEFGLSSEGAIHTIKPVQGKMDVKIKNIDNLIKGLVAVGIIQESQAGLVTAGSNILGKLGLNEITLPLKIDNGAVTLGFLPLFKIGNSVE